MSAESRGIPRPSRQLPPLGLYVHVPWCVRKCPYCDFNSHTLRDALPETAYVDALLADLDQDLPRAQGRAVSSVFIGGGTPSLLSPHSVARLLDGIAQRLALEPTLEVTLEANPGTVDQAHFAGFRSAGVNRLSIGVQSFDAGSLERLGRIHGPQEAVAAARAARAAGFENLNLDLMFALPGQTPTGALTDVEQAVALEPTHISLYQLTLEPNTLFHRYPPALPPEDVAWAMQQDCHARLARHGYKRYEVSAFATPGRASRHNLNYWRFGDYLGIGAGAHDKLTDRVSGTVQRRWKLRHPRDYLAHAGDESGIGGARALASVELPLEFMMNALRLVEGVPADLYARHTDLDPLSLQAPLARARARGLMDEDPGRLRATTLGLRFLDELLTLFVP